VVGGRRGGRRRWIGGGGSGSGSESGRGGGDGGLMDGGIWGQDGSRDIGGEDLC